MPASEPSPIVLPTPPTVPAGGGLFGITALLGGLGSVGLVAGAGSGGLHGPMLISSALMLAGSVGTAVAQLDQRHRHRASAVDGPRESFARQLDAAREAVVGAGADQRRRAFARHPDAGAMVSLPTDAAWTTRAGEPGFLHVRRGTADRTLEPPLLVPAETSGRPDPWCLAALRRFVAVHESQPDLPDVVDLGATPTLEAEADVVRAIVCSAVFSHPPGDLAVELDAEPPHAAAWDWLKWLPHLRSSGATHTLVVHDRPELPIARERTTLLRVISGSSSRLDRCDPATAEAIARRLADLADRRSQIRVDPWHAVLDGHLPGRRVETDRLRVPIGTDDAGDPVLLDLKESAHGGMGPHGLLVGATGSGKSELLRTLVLGLAASHPPEQLNLVLADFKGGATFAGLAPLPHVAALITNLADDLALVDRMEDALAGELQRRQEALRAAGGFASVDEYERHRQRDRAMEPMPSLVIVVDEFSELLSARPQLVDLFVAIGRLGRSLGLHLLLASQRLEEGRLRGLESHLSYRLGLRTFSAAESQTVLGTAAAYQLPSTPGLGYLRTDPSTLVRFRAEYVSGLVSGRSRTAEPVLPFGLASAHLDASHGDDPTSNARSTLSAVVERLSEVGPKARAIWLAPLAESPSLVGLRGDSAAGRLVVGLVDRPREQRRDPLFLDLRGATGNVAVVGGPRSGKSTLLRTVTAAIALARSPDDVHLHVLDLGGSLRDLATWPHTSSYATRGDGETVRRTVAELVAIVERREAGEHGADLALVVDGWSAFRESYDDLEPAVRQLAARGLAVGVHVVVSALRWSDLRSSLRDLFGTRLELRLGDPLDSEVDRHRAARVPAGRPGHGLTPDGASFVAAVPPDDVEARARRRWGDVTAPRLATLPTRVTLDEIRPAGPALVLGLGERDLSPVMLEDGQHLLAVGDAGSGKTTLLHTVAREVVRLHGPDTEVVVLDPRRSLATAPIGPRWTRAITTEDATRVVAQLAADLEIRLACDGRSPPVHVLVDDHDLLTPLPGSGRTSPLLPLIPLLARGPEIGLQLILTRRSGGIGRALYEPVIQVLRELGAPALLLSGSPDEGPLIGSHRLATAIPGRARLVTRAGAQTIQLADGAPA